MSSSNNSLIFPRVFTTQADYTISGWLKATAADYGIILENRAPAANGPLLYTIKITGKASSFFNPPSASADSTVTAADNTWHYVVGARAGNTMSVYVDGNAPVTQTIAAATEWGTDARIAEDYTNVFKTQSSDEVRVSTVARSASWIKTEYNNQSAPATYISVGSRITGSSNKVTHRVTQN